MSEWIPFGLTWAVVLVSFGLQLVATKRLRAARAELARLHEAVARRRLALPEITLDEQCRVTELAFDLGPVATEGEVQLHIPIMRGLGKMTMQGYDVDGAGVRLLVDFEAGVIARATAGDDGLPRMMPGVPHAFRRAFDG